MFFRFPMRAKIHKITWRCKSIKSPGPKEKTEVNEAKAPTELVATDVATAVSWAD